MSIVQQLCPACAAPLPIQPGERRLKCVYCGADLTIERDGNDISVTLADEVIGKIEQSGAQTQAEFQRLRLTQQLHAAEMRLANVQSEIRTIQRGPSNTMSRTQLNQLHEESLALEKQIAELKYQIDPTSAPAPGEQDGDKKSFTKNRLIELLFSFRGRISRSEFWIGMAISAVVFILLVSIVPRTPENADGTTAAADMPAALSCFAFILMVASIWISSAVGAKRFHDRDKSGWWVLVSLIPLVGFFWYIIELGMLPGTPGPNKYG